MERRDWVLALIYTPLMFLQFYLAWTHYNQMGLNYMVNFGWFILMISAIFGWLPIYAFKKGGGVQEGESYIKTTKLVDTGIYGIIRHPQYCASILISVSMVLMSQYWLSLAAGVIVVITWYIECLYADRRLINKYGEEYRNYMERVPRINFILGIFRIFFQVRVRDRRGGKRLHRAGEKFGLGN